MSDIGKKHLKKKDFACPRDKGLMREMEQGEATLDVCTKCGAQYFDSGEMFAAFGMKADPSYWDRPETGGAVAQGTLHCPQCEIFMLAQKVKYGDDEVEIDRCGKCGGIFLDRGEVDSIMRISDKLAPVLEEQRKKAQEELDKIGDPFGSPGLIARFLGMFKKK